MAKISIVEKGEDFQFQFTLGGDSIQGWICTINLRKFPGDTSLVTRTITPTGNAWNGALTSTETETLDTGLYRLVGVLTNATTDEERQPTIRLNVTETWAS